MVDYAGYALPVHYQGILQEHRAVRTGTGLFDVSHMGEILLEGPWDVLMECLQDLLARDIPRISMDRALYSPMLQEDGGTVDDLLVYLAPEWLASDTDRGGPAPARVLLVVNAANRAKDLDWIRSRAPRRVRVTDRSDDIAQLALQGPAAADCLSRVFGRTDPVRGPEAAGRALALGSYRWTSAFLQEGRRIRPMLVSRTGYTGEDGFEVYLSPEDAPWLWQLFLEAGAVPAGLGARDSLRFEAGLPLYGHELDAAITPLEAGLDRFVAPPGTRGKEDCPGIAALARPPARALVGFACPGRAIPRAGCPVLHRGEPVGHVTSGLFAPSFSRGLAMALVPRALARSLALHSAASPPPDASVIAVAGFSIRIRDRVEPAYPVSLPFYRRSPAQATAFHP